MNDFVLLLENLFEGDLKNMIRPVVSIDDFESKIDENTMVITYYLINEDAAEDLSIFIERSALDFILDTDISPTTNKDGDYLVFVEMDITDKTFNQVTTQITELNRIASIVSEIKNWRFKNNRILGTKTHLASEKNIKVLLKKIKEH